MMIKSFAAAVAVVLATGSISANASPLDPETSSVGITYNQATGSSASGTTYVELDGANASVTLSPYASAQAKIGSSYTQFVTADLYYSFEVVGGNVGDLVPVLIATDLLSSGTYPQYASASISIMNGSIGLAGANVCDYTSDCSASQFNGTLSLTATSGTEYRIHLKATAEGVDVFASADPHIFVDPSFMEAATYNIQLSDGVANALQATPLPAALPVFVSGLGALVLLAWRGRKRKFSLVD